MVSFPRRRESMLHVQERRPYGFPEFTKQVQRVEVT